MKRVPVVAGSLLLTLTVSVSSCLPDNHAFGPEVQPPMFNSVHDLGLQPTGRIIILGNGSRLPNNLEARVRAAGGVLVQTMPEIGVAFAEAARPGFAEQAARIPGVESVVPDVMLQWTNPVTARGDAVLEAGEITAAELQAMAEPSDPFYQGLQWAPQAIQAPEAWAAGYTGSGVRVAILDGGIHSSHIDLAGNLDVAASRSFTTGAFNTDVGTFWHGTHVAGIVAASANGIGTVGIAPAATLIGVKVLHGGSGSLESVLGGILYAATPQASGGAGANVMNLSLGLVWPRRDAWEDPAFRTFFNEWTKLFDRAMRYAWQQGVTVIVAAGNDALDFDGGNTLYALPAQSQHAISVSATGPHGWALGADDFHRPAYYTNYGRTAVDLAAPGGTIGLWWIDGVDQLCVRPIPNAGNILHFCETFDLIYSTTRGSGASIDSYGWAQGTSMAAPAVAGVAALIIERHGGSLPPSQVRAILQQSASDLGDPGNDPYYGMGWVNAWRAVR